MFRSLVRLAVVAAVVPAALRAQATGALSGGTPRPVWTPIVRTAAVLASIDTSRVERTTTGSSRLWYRFAFTAPLALGDDAASRFEATEMRMEVDCRAQRARTLTIRMESTEGIQADVPASDSAWKAFAAHPMGAGIFGPACAALGTPLPAGAPSAASSAVPAAPKP